MHNLLSRQIAHVLLGALIITILVVGGAVIWMSREHNRQASMSSATMVAGGVEGIEKTLETITRDYSMWEEARKNTVAMDDAWVQANMGTGVTESRAMDLLVVVQPDGSIRYGWNSESADERDPGVMPPDVLQDIQKGLAGARVAEGDVFMTVRPIGEKIYVLAAAPLAPDAEGFAPTDAPPLGIFGLIMTKERIDALGKSFLIDDLALADLRATEKLTHVLRDAEGKAIAQLEWTPYRPGDVLLQRVALPVSAVLCLFGFAGLHGARGAYRNADVLARNEREASRMARCDPLTGLPNRLHLTEKMQESAIQRACRNGRFSALFIDLDDFKHVNDTIGHAGGDALIKAFCTALQTALPKECFFGRVGGDEFNIMITARDPRRAAESVAASVVDLLKRDLDVFGRSFRVSASIGYAVSSAGDTLPEEILRRADVAMYEAKSRRSGEPMLYMPDYESELHKHKAFEEALRQAIREETLEVHYQPIVSATTQTLESVEALVRWTSPEFGVMSPAVFVSIAEQAGMMGELGDFVFRRALADMASVPDLRVSLNVSPVQLRNPAFVDNLMGLVAAAGMTPRRIQIELTEGILVTHPDIARRKFEALKRHGFDIALDDFGTGFSSIGYLRQLPFDALKIDRSFVSEIVQSPQAARLLQSLASFGKALNLKVVAEGVETEEQQRLLQLSGCDQLQGYYFSKAVSFADLCALYDLGAGGGSRRPARANRSS